METVETKLVETIWKKIDPVVTLIWNDLIESLSLLEDLLHIWSIVLKCEFFKSSWILMQNLLFILSKRMEQTEYFWWIRQKKFFFLNCFFQKGWTETFLFSKFFFNVSFSKNPLNKLWTNSIKSSNLSTKAICLRGRFQMSFFFFELCSVMIHQTYFFSHGHLITYNCYSSPVLPSSRTPMST